jgi:hypothetical protein
MEQLGSEWPPNLWFSSDHFHVQTLINISFNFSFSKSALAANWCSHRLHHSRSQLSSHALGLSQASRQPFLKIENEARDFSQTPENSRSWTWKSSQTEDKQPVWRKPSTWSPARWRTPSTRSQAKCRTHPHMGPSRLKNASPARGLARMKNASPARGLARGEERIPTWGQARCEERIPGRGQILAEEPSPAGVKLERIDNEMKNKACK